MRPVDGVIDAILMLVPASHPDRPRLVRHLNSIKGMAMGATSYPSPEGNYSYFQEISHALQSYVGDPERAAWMGQVRDVQGGLINFQDVLDRVVVPEA